MEGMLLRTSCVLLGTIATLVAGSTGRQAMRDEMKRRPDEPWPRGQGHVLLAVPGSDEDSKAYHEPGAGFSPAFGSFGVSIQVEDENGRRIAAGDTVPIGEVRQRLVWKNAKDVPGIFTRTKQFQATWSRARRSGWNLATKATVGNLAIVIRSPGPAGGALTNLHWNGKSLVINDYWRVTPNPLPNEIILDEEDGTNRVVVRRERETWKIAEGVEGLASESSWRRALFRFGDTAGLQIEAPSTPASSLKFQRINPALDIQLPEAQFMECLDAQVAHLMMGLVRNETRPGDPNNYPLNWLRDGAMTLVALARAGQLDVARQLCVPFIEHDFFGGFGSEADGPGLAAWALTEVAALLRDPRFDQQIWPAVERKMGLIDEMLHATGPILKPWYGPLVPGKAESMRPELVCDSAAEGLITGKMDGQRPVLYVNAVSYAGLQGAVDLARRLKQPAKAELWATESRALRTAWNKALTLERHGNERNFICGLHPTWVVNDPRHYFEPLLEHWRLVHDRNDQYKERPRWTYFNVAEANQWLVLGEIDRTWSILQWFWANQASPGLFTWWEGTGEENSFRRWERVRGWMDPPNVTPHYWTAAEMLLLQLAMLAYVDESGPEPVLVVGAGVRSEWLEGTLKAGRLPTKLGVVSWEWDTKSMHVRIPGFKGDVRLGPPFPEDTKLRIN